MNSRNIRDEQLSLLKILLAFSAFCKENKVRYYLHCGTMLGAVREHGFIPWDSDIDLIMSYDEYKRLNVLAAENGNMINGYKWVTYKTDRHIPTFFAKIYDSHVTESNLDNYPYIEICPFTGAPNRKWLQTLIWRTNLWNYDVYWVKNRIYRNSLYRKHSRVGFAAKVLLFWWPSVFSRKYFEYCCTKWPLQSANMCFHLTSIYSVKRVAIPPEWLLEEPIYIEFEGHEFPIMRHYHEYLTQLYGNYMTPIQYRRFK